jgi:hypothetical protein
MPPNTFSNTWQPQGYSDFRPPGELDPNALMAHNLFGNISSDFGGQLQNLLNQIGGSDYTAGLTGYSNPYQQQYQQMMSRLGKGTDTAGLQNFLNQFMPQGGGGWENLPVNMPGMERATGAERFAAGGSPVNAPGYGMGGNFVNMLLGSGTQQGGGGYAGATPDVQQARQAQLSSLLNKSGGGGMSESDMRQAYEASMSPVREELGRARTEAYGAASNRGFGRSTESGRNIEGDYTRRLSDAALRTQANLAAQDRAARERASEFGTSGLGEYARAGVTEGLGAADIGTRARQIANQYNLGLGGLGESAAGRVGAGQQWARGQGFDESLARANMSRGLTGDINQQQLARYQTELEGMLQARGLGGQEARDQASQMLETLGMGMQGQQFGQSQLANFLLNAGGQDQSAWATGQGNQLTGQGMNLNNQQLIGQLLSGMTGTGLEGLLNVMNQELTRGGMEARGREFRSGERERARGGGVGGALAGIGGALGGSLLGPVGAVGGNWLANLLSGGGNQTGTGGGNPGGYWGNNMALGY